jgi:hypothetical protein
MNDATLKAFRELAAAMQGNAPQDWQWVGKHMSQRMFGITKARATEYVRLYGGKAEPMRAAP